MTQIPFGQIHCFGKADRFSFGLCGTVGSCRDPGSGDYRLMETSPAWVLGIKEIDTSGIGIQEKLRYSTP